MGPFLREQCSPSQVLLPFCSRTSAKPRLSPHATAATAVRAEPLPCHEKPEHRAQGAAPHLAASGENPRGHEGPAPSPAQNKETKAFFKKAHTWIREPVRPRGERGVGVVPVGAPPL